MRLQHLPLPPAADLQSMPAHVQAPYAWLNHARTDRHRLLSALLLCSSPCARYSHVEQLCALAQALSGRQGVYLER